MSLKDQIKNDVKNVFINLGEFAETLTYNNVNISVVQDKDQLMKKQQIDGQVAGHNLIFGAVADFVTAPNVGDAVKLNNKKATIVDISEDDGLYEIILREMRR